jgi:hypothetical protein
MKGPCKTGVLSCVANMQVMTDTNTHAVIVEYCSMHTGHEINICRLPIPSNVRLSIAAKLHDGVSVNKILDSIRDGAGNSKNRRRLLLLSRQDILNIHKKLNIKSITKHTNDCFSTSIWVEELKSQPQNPVLLYKAQGVPQLEGMDNSGNDDFLLVLQTPFQRDVMQQYGNKAILMDATHSLTEYDFLLISIMVIDNYGEGIPGPGQLAIGRIQHF